MHLVIEASNIRKGGGLTHLQEILRAVDFDSFGIEKVTIWGSQKTLEKLPDSPYLTFRSHPWIDKGGVWSFLFRNVVLDRQLDSSVDLLWAPGGTYTGQFRPYVTMVRNFLPFDRPERNRFRFSTTWARYLLLERLQLRSFRCSNGLIHISKKCDEVINQLTDLSRVQQTLIYHGINRKFFHAPRRQRQFAEFTRENPARILYVSTVDMHKHQDKLVDAVALLRNKIPLRLDLVGSAYPPALKKLENAIKRSDPNLEWVKWHGEANYEEVETFYQQADLYTCMSTCETFGMILLEAMASGLPVVCSNRSALPEIHNGTCLSVNPEDSGEVAEKLEIMLRDAELRDAYANSAYLRAQEFSWEKCAYETFEFLCDVYEKTRTKNVTPR